MSKRFVFIEDLHASEINLDFEMGLLYQKGAIVDNFLPGMEELLLEKGKILPEAEWWKLQADNAKRKSEQLVPAADSEEKAKPGHANKRGRGAVTNKQK